MNWLKQVIDRDGKPNFPCENVKVTPTGVSFTMDSVHFNVADNTITFKDAGVTVKGTKADARDKLELPKLAGVVLPHQYTIAYLQCNIPNPKEATEDSWLYAQAKEGSKHVKKFLGRVLEACAEAGLPNPSNEMAEHVKFISQMKTFKNEPSKLETIRTNTFAKFLPMRDTADTEPVSLTDLNSFVFARLDLALLLGKHNRIGPYKREKFLIEDPHDGEPFTDAIKDVLQGTKVAVSETGNKQSAFVGIGQSTFQGVICQKGRVLVGEVYPVLLQQEGTQERIASYTKGVADAQDIDISSYVPSNDVEWAVNAEIIAAGGAIAPIPNRRRKNHVVEIPLF